MALKRTYKVNATSGLTSGEVTAIVDGVTTTLQTNIDNVATTSQQNITAHTSDVANPHSTTKAQVGLGNVDNTSDINKPVSTAQNTAITGVQINLNTHTGNTANPHGTTKAQVGLGNVDNTADIAKPVSTAQQNEINTALGAITGNTTRVPFFSAAINRLASSANFIYNLATGTLSLYNSGTLEVGLNATNYFRLAWITGVGYLQTFSNLFPIEIQGSHVRVTSQLRVGSAVAPTATLDVTGTTILGGNTTVNGAHTINGVAIFNNSERHKGIINDLDITLNTTHYALYMYNAVARTVTLPDPINVPGTVYVVKRTGAGTVTLATLGPTQLIENLTGTFTATTTLANVGTYGSSATFMAFASGHWRRIA